MPPSNPPVRYLPPDLHWCAYDGHARRWHVLDCRDNSLSWGGALLVCVDTATADYVRANGKLPKGATNATD